MPDEFMTSHPEDKVPLHRNIAPIPECPVRPAVINGERCEAVEVRIQTCAGAWLRCQQEAEQVVAPGGKFIDDALLRNRRINAAYASLWLRNNRFQWAALAAFASKQVGCGLLHSAHIIDKTSSEVSGNGGGDSFEWLFKNLFPATVNAGTGYMQGQLSLGNATLFLDIYPLHRFYELRGLAGLEKCLADREKIKDKVKWPVAEATLPFGKVFNQITQGFREIEAGQIARSVMTLAYHEQVNILQPVIYDDLKTRLALDGNQFAWASNLPTGDFSEVQLTLSAQCAARPSPLTTWFSKSQQYHLYNVAHRMEFVQRAAVQFDKLLQGSERKAIEASLREIAAGGGVH